jgi:alanine-glyoxylate transaminase/serine-glyoxylate transaminase/serine-pyruvate transaminase
MQNYEAKKPSYFATPSPQLVHALHTALSQILARPVSDRFAAHKAGSDKIKKAVADLGLKQVAANPDEQAHGMTAIYLPEGVKGADLLPILAKKGVVFAGGIHKEIAAKYIRFGHMGVSLVSSFASGLILERIGVDIFAARCQPERRAPCDQVAGGGLGRVRV